MEENFGKNYCDKVSENISNIMKMNNLKQGDVVELCKKAGVSISQSTLSNIKRGDTKISLTSIVNICKGLNISIYDVLPEISEKDIHREGKKINGASDIAYKGYLGKYHVYFFPTISNKEELLHGDLEIYPPSEEKICKAKMILYTGDKKIVNGKTEEIVKEYEGEFVISVPMQSGYCMLRNSKIDELCFFVFHHWHIFNNDLLCRIAAVATTSAGANRRPTIHRLYMCRDELSAENQKYIRGQLRLNESEILIAKEKYAQLLSKENIPLEFQEIFEKEAKLEQYYSVTEAKLINCNILDKDFAQAISLLRDYSAAPKYNKVSMKTDEFVYDYYQKKEE